MKRIPNLEKLRKFVESDDRGATPIFAGRAKEISAVSEDLRRRVGDWAGGDLDAFDSATWLIQGAPGAGKTATLKHLAATLPGEFGELQVCQLVSEKLKDDSHTHGRLAGALNPSLRDQANREISKTFGGGARFWGFGGDASRTTKTKVPSAWERFVELAQEAPDSLRPILLLIDEIQNVPGGRGDPPSAFLSSLHQAADRLPVFPVYGGLAWSEGRLDELGLSRTSRSGGAPPHVSTLAPLSEAETRAVCARFFDHFEIDGGSANKERWTRKVVAESLGWPQHVHTHLQALGDALLSAAGDLDAIAVEREAKVTGRAAAERELYYGNRLVQGALRDCGRLAAAAALRVGPGKDTVARLGREIERIAERHAPDDPDMELPEGMTGRAFADAMIRGGILHKSMEGGKGLLSVPIPSFLKYLEREFKTPDDQPEPGNVSNPPPAGI